MELAKEIVSGLANIQNNNILPEETFIQLLDIIMCYVCKNGTDAKSKCNKFYLQNILVKQIIYEIFINYLEN